jgi:hypothetical protein
LLIVALQHKSFEAKMTQFRSAMAAAAILISMSASSFAGDVLSTNELKQLAPGRFLVSVYGTSMTVTLRPNGSVQGAAKGESDSGHWNLSGNRLCIGWNKWLGGKTRCSSLVSQVGYYQGSGFTFKRI